MSALPYQPAQTIGQRKGLHAHPARQYRDNQDEAIAEMQAARLRYEMDRNAAQPEPCQFCAVEDEATGGSLLRFVAVSIGSLGLWCAIGYAMWWFTPKAVDLITWILEKHA